MDRFASMMAFAQVAESGGFTAAARHLGLSVASVSAQVQVLEEALGARLLNRTTRRVSLTEMITRTLGKSPRVLCCAPAYLKTHEEPCTPADLAGHNVLLYAYWSFGHEARFTHPSGESVVVRLSGNLVTTSIALLRDAAIAGIGLALLTPYSVSDVLASGELVPLLSDYGKPELEAVALYPHRRHLTAKVRLFLDRLAEQFAEELRRG